MDPELYLKVREKEGRLYSDQIVAGLPFLSDDQPLVGEWLARAASTHRLVRYLSTRQKSLIMLDLGCGNGWLSNVLAKAGHTVIGLDQNHVELKQAARVFSTNPKVSFLEANIFTAPFVEDLFDVIILASVLQYFPDVFHLVSKLSNYLKPQGEIHILDSPLYSDSEIEQAMLRSREYYASLGFPEMSSHYFHHRISDLEALHPVKLYNPRLLTSRLRRWVGWADSPFPWLAIRKIN